MLVLKDVYIPAVFDDTAIAYRFCDPFTVWFCPFAALITVDSDHISTLLAIGYRPILARIVVVSVHEQ